MVAGSEVPQHHDIDDIEAYVSTFDEEERNDLAAAEAAIDIAILLHRARERRGLSQAAAARQAGLQQQAVSRFESPSANPQLDTVRTYLNALGYGVQLNVIDLETGEAAFSLQLPPARSRRTA
jgi:DNA-binding phage protein